MTDPSHPPPKSPASQTGTHPKITAYSVITATLEQGQLIGAHPDIRFLKNVTGAFVAWGINPRESVAYFGFYHDGLLEPCALGFKLWTDK